MTGEKNLLAWNMTRKCNFRCQYCYFPHDNTPIGEGLPADRILGFLNGTGREWVVGMTGGEPLIYPDFVELCRRLTDRHKIEIDSNLSLTAKVRKMAEHLPPDRVVDIYAALHIEERERRGAVAEFIENVQLLLKKGFHVSVNYVIHPDLIERYPSDREYFASHGIKLIPRPFKGSHDGVDYPAGYGAKARELFAGKTKAGKKMVYNFKGIPCNAGRRLVRMDPDGTVYRCSGDLTVMGNVLDTISLYEKPTPCKVGRCPCFGPDYVVLNDAGELLLEGLAQLVLDQKGKAIESFTGILELQPEASNAQNNLAVAHWRSGEMDKALRAVSKAHGRHPFNKVYVMNLAAFSVSAGYGEQAVEACRNFLEKHDDQQVRGLLEKIVHGDEIREQGRICVDFIPGNNTTDIYPA